MKPLWQLPAAIDVDRLNLIQEELAARVRLEPCRRVATVAGVDAAYANGKGWGAVSLTDAAGNLIETCVSEQADVKFPYLPGYLAWRECTVVARALEMLSGQPDCILVDGHGILHPRFFGLACAIGLMFDVCAIGCAKSPWRADWSEPGPARGDWTPVRLDGRVVGATVRTRSGVRPVWVSPGHKCDLESSVRTVLDISRTRIPEPLRLAHSAAQAACSAAHTCAG